MDLSIDAIHDIIHPTAVFSVWSDNGSKDNDKTASADSWDDSQLNPKNRIDCLDPPKSPLWSIDGCTGLGTQFYVVPLFLGDAPPMRLDVFIAETAVESPKMRKLLDLDMVFHAKDRSRVRRQAIASYILRALQYWTMRTYGLEKAKDMYHNLPFGTRIIFENLALDVRDTRISIAPMHNLEYQQFSAKALSTMWKMDLDRIPPSVDIADLIFVQQLHDSVCLVRYRQGDTGKLWILKALTSSVNYMYHEIRTLLAMEPHPNVISKPARLVTKPYKWINSIQKVVGFLEPYHSGGNLRDTLPLLRIHDKLHCADQLRWATQITSGLLHIRQRGKTYYPDLRLDNIVLSASGDAVILDLEQRGVWVEFSSPEVNALEYMRVLAVDESAEDKDEELENAGADGDEFVLVNDSSGSRSRYTALLDRCLPGWQHLQGREEYTNPPDGYNIPWLCLSPREQEAAEVYMLGRVLWCIFEGMSAPQRGAVWQSYRYEPDIEFPEFRRTPKQMAALIDRCTRGRRDQLSSHVIRKGSKLVLRDDLRAPSDAAGEGTEAEIRRVSKAWWLAEMKWAEEFLLMREEGKKHGTWDENYYGRPPLREVESALEAFRAKVLLSD